MPRCEMETAMRLHQTMKDHNIKPSVESYNSLLCVFRRSGRSGGGDVEAAMRILEEMKAAGIKADAITYNIMLDVCSCVLPHSDVSAAQAVWRRMEEQDIVPDVQSYTTMICVWSRSGGRQGGGLEALRLWREMEEQRGVSTDIITFSALIDALSREEGGALMEEVNRVYSTMVGRGVKPNIITYNSLIAACSRAKPFADTSRAKELYFEAKRADIKMDIRIFNSLITCFSRGSGGGDVERAMWAWREMEAVAIKPNEVAINVLMTTYNNSGRQDCWEVAKHLLEDMRERNIRPDVELLTSTMTACGRGGGSISEAMSVFRQMTEGEGAVVPEETCFNALINVCIGSSSTSRFGSSREFTGDMDAAMSVFSEIKRRGIRPGVWTFNTLISGCSRRRGGADVELGMSLFREMESMGVEGDVWMYNSMIQLFCCGNNKNNNRSSSFQKRLVSNGDLERAMAVFSRMKEHRIEPNAATFNTLIAGCSRADPVRMDLAMEVYEEAKRQQQQMSLSSKGGMVIDSPLIASLFSVCARTRSPGSDLETTMRIMREAEEMDIEINTVAWNSFLQVCRSTRQPSIDIAEDVIRRMREGSNRRTNSAQDNNNNNEERRGGCEPNSATYSTLLMCYVRSHRRSDLEKGLRVFEGVEDRSKDAPVFSAAFHLLRQLIQRGGLSRQEEEEARRYGRRMFEEAERRVRPWPNKFIIDIAQQAGIL